MEIQLSVKELSEVTGVSKRNIRYYDSIGLLKASGTRENGYRYYSMEKIEELNIINHLRSIGISIDKIKEQMTVKNLDTYDQILNDHLKEVSEEIKHLKHVKHEIERRIDTLEYVKSIPETNKIIVEHIPKCKILKMDYAIHTPAELVDALSIFAKKYELENGIFIGDLGFLIDMDTVLTRTGDDFIGLYLMLDEKADVFAEQVPLVEETDWLTLYIKGDHHDAAKHYPKMLAYAKKHNITLYDFSTERTLVDSFISSDSDNHITQIMIPINVN
jgi:DNA-binding transcriptional MerR regulator